MVTWFGVNRAEKRERHKHTYEKHTLSTITDLVCTRSFQVISSQDTTDREETLRTLKRNRNKLQVSSRRSQWSEIAHLVNRCE